MHWLNHVIHMLLPAFVLAIVVTVLARLLQWRKKQRFGFMVHWLCLFMGGAATTVISLIYFQSDGKMLGYVALVVVMGSIQTLLSGGSVPKMQAQEAQVKEVVAD